MEINELSQDDFASRPRNLKELAARYGCTPKTFRRWLAKAKLDLGDKLGYYFTPRQVKMILDHMNAPILCLAIAMWVLEPGPADHDGRLAIVETGKAASEFRLSDRVGNHAPSGMITYRAIH
jgi:hypothetical protein